MDFAEASHSSPKDLPASPPTLSEDPDRPARPPGLPLSIPVTLPLALPKAVEWTRQILTCPAEQLAAEAQGALAWIAQCLEAELVTLWTVRTQASLDTLVAFPEWHSQRDAWLAAPTPLSADLWTRLQAESPIELASPGLLFPSFAADPHPATPVLCFSSWAETTLRAILTVEGRTEIPADTSQALHLLTDALANRAAPPHRELGMDWSSEWALRESMERLDDILVAAGIAVWSWRLSAERSRFDERFLSLLGIGMEERHGTIRDWYSLIHVDDRPHVNRQWDLHVHEGAPSYRAEYRVRSRDRGWRWILDVGKVKQREKDGTPISMIGVAVDRTDLRTLEDQLRHAQKLETLGRMAGSVAHDFNNMIAVIAGYTEMLLLNSTPESPLRPHAIAIQAAAQRAAAIADDLLSFRRSEPARLEVIDLNETIQGIGGMLRHLAGKGVDVELQLHPAPMYILAGKSQLEQILVNLALNAGDAMSASGGTLTIRTSLVEIFTPDFPAVLLTIQDTGTGMDQETLAHLFEPFFTSKPEGKGTGLGLARTPITVQEWGGTVEVWSQPGVGTTFDLQFPLAKPPTTPQLWR